MGERSGEGSMDKTDVFDRYRPLLFSIAYRMLGSVMDAEDVVQEAYPRWRGVSRDEVDLPKSYLSAVVTRLCIDHLRSAKVWREQYVGPWLPEPLLTDSVPDAADTVALDDSLSMAFLVLLESLTPTERAIFLMREVFGYEYQEIARIVGKSEANCRQIARRAREAVAARRPRFDASKEQEERLTRRFVEICMDGDMKSLLRILSEDIILWSDGGGQVRAALNPIRGSEKVSRFLFGILGKTPGFSTRMASINGQTGIIGYVDGHPIGTVTLDIAGDLIEGIRIVVNPEKLSTIPPLL